MVRFLWFGGVGWLTLSPLQPTSACYDSDGLLALALGSCVHHQLPRAHLPPYVVDCMQWHGTWVGRGQEGVTWVGRGQEGVTWVGGGQEGGA